MPAEESARARDALVEELRARGAVTSPRVMDALRRVPREAFLPEAQRESAYHDAPLPLEAGQTMSAPHMVAMMAEALGAEPGHRVLEVGGGSGYHAAVLAHLVAPGGHVWCVERVPTLAAAARRQLTDAGYADAVTVVEGDGAEGLPAHAPFDRVSVACAAPAVPLALAQQLAPDGRLLIPLGTREAQELTLVTKREDGTLAGVPLGGCRFVPLTGPHGFDA